MLTARDVLSLLYIQTAEVQGWRGLALLLTESFASFRRDEVNKAYRRLAVLLHPDKCVAPGSEDAFKAVVNARTALLKNIK